MAIASAKDFIEKWGPGGPAYHLNERAGAQPHFMDLCHLLGVPTPGNAENYCFERGLVKTGSKTGNTNGFADVWFRGHFAWEYKAPHKDLNAALQQLMMYALPLENPPLLVVSDRLKTEIHTHFTGTPSERHIILLEDLNSPEAQEKLRWLFASPEKFRPRRTNRDITEEAARTFAATAERLRESGVPPEKVSHFLTQCVFCFFAEDVGLLPERLFERLVGVKISPEKLRAQLEELFRTMADGGFFGVSELPWFNGGLFASISVPMLTHADVLALRNASGLNWSSIDPSIFGTLFERGLDPSKRSQLGAHYTDPATIHRLIEPVVSRPLLQRWEVVKEGIAKSLVERDRLRTDAEKIPGTTPALKNKYAKLRASAAKHERTAGNSFGEYLEALRAFRVLDPACGSGNFLYLALKVLKDIEHRVNIEAEALGLQRQYDVTGPHNVLGIEINEYAAELARVTVWIGELQWRLQRGYGFNTNPVLEPLEHIECKDAVLGSDGKPSEWPASDVVIGNPPFVGDKKMRGELGGAYTDKLRAAFKGKIPGNADFVCFWYDQAIALISEGKLKRAGFVATNSIRQGANREVLQRAKAVSRIFEAWSDEDWVNEGANVRVSLVAFGESEQVPLLDGEVVDEIYADLTGRALDAAAMDLTTAEQLAENAGTSFFGLCLSGPFEVSAELARQWLHLPNPNRRPNSDVLVPLLNGSDLTKQRPRDRWAIDFGPTMTEEVAAMYEAPFAYASNLIKPKRLSNARAARANNWWRHGETRPGMRKALANISRWIVTSETAKHRCFVWMNRGVAPEHKLVVIARADDYTFGVLSSRIHVLWAIEVGSTLEDRPVYPTGVCFCAFPFPAGLTPADTAHQHVETLADGTVIPGGLNPGLARVAERVARAAARLNNLREKWLNPPEWVALSPEVVPLGMATSPYPDRIVPRSGFESVVAKRTITGLYNELPQWLRNAHVELDAAVAAAYGWADYTTSMPDGEILSRLLRLNHARSAVNSP